VSAARAAAIAIAFIWSAAVSLAAGPIVRWVQSGPDPSQVTAEVAGLDTKALAGTGNNPAEWRKIFPVFAVPLGEADPAADLPPMAGAYEVREGSLVFAPQFPLRAGISYRAVFHPGDQGHAVEARYTLPAAARSPGTIVEQVYPTAAVLPENLLKFYLHFSAPMSRGDIYQFIHLYREDGRAVELPFLELGEELWDPAMKRLTLLLDPGRIKRGVRPREDEGAILIPGERYRLVIDAAWKDAAGQPLVRAFEKAFTAAPARREPVDPARWIITAPKAGSREPLQVRFDTPMDHALAQRLISVRDEAGKTIEGEVRLADEERVWSLTPAENWPVGRLAIVVPVTIEDLAGNNIGKPFDLDLSETARPTEAHQVVTVAFQTQ
jgi:hypothetical protein